MKNKTKFILLTAALLVIAASSVISQQKQVPEAKIYYSSNQDANNPEISMHKPYSKPAGAEETELLRQLETARLSGNTMAAEQIQAKLDKLRGEVQVVMHEAPAQYIFVNGENELDYNQMQIQSNNIRSHAFGVAPAGSTISGKLFYVYIRDAQPNVDTLVIMQSSNNGTSWTVFFKLYMQGYSYNKDEMDMEMVYDGTNTYMFLTAGVTSISDSRKKIYFLRYNLTGANIAGSVMDFPGSGAGMNYYNPRLTSDNANYTSTARVMLICSMDSLGGTNHYVKQKFALLSSPFAALVAFNYTQPNGSNGFGWMGNNGTNANSYLYGDIAYYKDDGGTGENRVMTVYGNPASGIYNVYMAYVSNYTTLGATMFVAVTTAFKDTKIAFNGGANNRNGLITFVKSFSATDWDIFELLTTSGGSTPASWTYASIDNDYDRSRTCDLIAVRNAPGQFKICYTQDTAGQPMAFYRSYNGSAWSQRYLFSTLKSDTIFASPRAGYILGGGDDGIGFWSAYGGLGSYESRFIISTTGIINSNNYASEYSLSQNYPNPFNPVTNIKFSIPKSGMVSLIVYDIAGREVTRLINGNLNSGTYTFEFDASNLSSGAYFYKLTAGEGFTEVKKMLLVK